MKSLMQRKGICIDARERVNAYLESHGLYPVAVTTWRDSIRPELERVGIAESQGRGRPVLYDADELWRWQEYIAKRQVLILLGIWHSKRAYSDADAYELVDDGIYDGEINHSMFDVALQAE